MNDAPPARLAEALVEKLRTRGIVDERVLDAVARTPRHLFVPEAVARRAYEDAALPIGYGQTISQPSIQALYLQLLELRPDDRVLEIGTGSGYQTALLAALAGQVYSVERIRDLSARARSALDRLRATNVALMVGDGTVGWSRYAPYRAILVAAAAPKVPEALVDQLAAGGRLLVPVGTREEQQLLRIRRTDGGLEQEPVTQCTFVPLVGRFGWPQSGKGRA